MTKDEALDLALEALKMCRGLIRNNIADGVAISSPNPFFSADVDAAITAIKKARSAPVQEPVASYKGPNELWLQLHGDCSEDELETPVDYTDDSVTWCWHQIHDSDVRYVRADIVTPPAAQRQWVGLSHEEVMDSWDEIRDGDWAPDFYAVIEAKLKEKNT